MAIPIPTYIDIPTVRTDILYDETGDEIGYFLADRGRHIFGECLNAMLLLSDDKLVKAVPEHYGLYNKWYFDLAGALKTASWSLADEIGSAAILSIVATYLNMPKELIDKIVNVVLISSDRWTGMVLGVCLS